MAGRNSRMAVRIKEPLVTKSHDPLITWSEKFPWQTETLYIHFKQVYGHLTLKGGA